MHALARKVIGSKAIFPLHEYGSEDNKNSKFENQNAKTLLYSPAWVSQPQSVVGVARNAMFRAVTDGWKRYWWGTGTEQPIMTSSINYQIDYSDMCN